MRNSIAAGAAHRPTKVVPKAEKKYQQGLALMQQGRYDEAARAFEAAIERSPTDAVFWLNLAQARRKQGRAESAIDAARRAVTLDPDSVLARRMLASCLTESGLHVEAASALDAPVGSNGERAAALTERGLALQRAGQMHASIAPLLEAARLEPTSIKTYIALSDGFKGLDMPEAAWECQRTAVALDSNNPYLLCSLIHLGLSACKWDGLSEATARLAELCAAGAGPAPVPFMHLSVPGASAQDHLRTAQAHCARTTGHVQPLAPVVPAQRRPGRIRLGYFSNDFHTHATAFLLARVLEQHDRDKFEVFAYSYGPDDGTPMRKRLVAAVEHFVDVQHESARTTAERIRADGIDLLVDLKGYTLNARPDVLAFRPAPVQINYLGYPGSMGAPFIDYIITDRVVTPPEMAGDFTEKFAYLPHSYQPNDDTRPIGPPPPRAECGLPDRAFVFCCFNNTYKITPDVFEVWCRLLRAVPDSVLWLLDANLQAKYNLWREAEARGVARERLIFAPKLPYERHLLRIRHADLFLDNLPVNAHTTASDALWAGVPIVTCAGSTFASRVCASLLDAVGLPEMVATSLSGYESLALRVASDRLLQSDLRQRLTSARHTSPLFKSEPYTRALEQAFWRMHQRWQQGLPPADLDPAPAATKADTNP
jgi:predicted O-linked N-acetylglucosamine transferase (SPINDLY family)